MVWSPLMSWICSAGRQVCKLAVDSTSPVRFPCREGAVWTRNSAKYRMCLWVCSAWHWSLTAESDRSGSNSASTGRWKHHPANCRSCWILKFFRFSFFAFCFVNRVLKMCYASTYFVGAIFRNSWAIRVYVWFINEASTCGWAFYFSCDRIAYEESHSTAVPTIRMWWWNGKLTILDFL